MFHFFVDLPFLVKVVSNNESESETIEIWDIRRSWIGKWALDDSEGGITGMLCFVNVVRRMLKDCRISHRYHILRLPQSLGAACQRHVLSARPS